MPKLGASFIDFKNWTSSEVYSLFQSAKNIESVSGTGWISSSAPDFPPESKAIQKTKGATAALLFFEPSTRTRMSFETACHRLGLYPLILDTAGGTSLEKGESVEDSIFNIAAMNPVLFIIRSSGALNFAEICHQLRVPVINAGWGAFGHPTQALLDAFTLFKKWGKLERKKLLVVGDIKFSRVAASHFELSSLLGYEVAVCGPAEFLPSTEETQRKGIRRFDHLKEGLAWADAVMMLRFQFERHSADLQFSEEDVRKNFGLTSETLRLVPPHVQIMHPGPVNHGIEMDDQALRDPRCLVLQQVTNGVFIRQALIEKVLQKDLA